MCFPEENNYLWEGKPMTEPVPCIRHTGSGWGQALNMCDLPGTKELRAMCEHNSQCDSGCCKPSRSKAGATCKERKSQSKKWYGSLFGTWVNTGRKCLD
jgi:hypothetical protein